MTFVLVFLAVALADACWTLYFLSIDANNAWWAGFWSMAIMGLSGFISISYNHNSTNLIPACLGAFVGTVGAMRLKNYLSRKT